MKKLISTIAVAGLLMSSAAHAGINPKNIDESSSRANILKVIDEKTAEGKTSGVIGMFAWTSINGEVYSASLAEIRRNARGGNYTKAFSEIIQQDVLEDVKIANQQELQDAIMALYSGNAGPSELEIAQQRIAFLQARGNLLEALTELDHDEHADHIASLKKSVADAHGEYLQTAADYVADQVELGRDENGEAVAASISELTGVTATYDADTNTISVDTSALEATKHAEGVASVNADYIFNGVTYNIVTEGVKSQSQLNALRNAVADYYTTSAYAEVRAQIHALVTAEGLSVTRPDTLTESNLTNYVQAVADAMEAKGDATAVARMYASINEELTIFAEDNEIALDADLDIDSMDDLVLAVGEMAGAYSLIAISEAANDLTGVSADADGALSFDTGYGLKTDNDNDAIDDAVDAVTEIAGISLESSNGVITLNLEDGNGIISTTAPTGVTIDASVATLGTVTLGDSYSGNFVGVNADGTYYATAGQNDENGAILSGYGSMTYAEAVEFLADTGESDYSITATVFSTTNFTVGLADGYGHVNQGIATAVNAVSGITGISLSANTDGVITLALTSGYQVIKDFKYATATAAAADHANSNYEDSLSSHSSFSIGNFDADTYTADTSIFADYDLINQNLQDEIEVALGAAYNDGYDEGFDDGYNAGYVDGFADGRAQNS